MQNILDIAQQIGLFLAGCVIAVATCRREINKYFGKQRTKVSDNLQKQSDIDIQILERMDYVKELLNADIIQVYEFHNGEHYSDGRSAMKVSCTYEVVRAGISSTMNKCKQIPIACLPRYIKNILDKGQFLCKDIEDMKESYPSSYEIMKSLDMKAFTSFALRNSKNQVIGFVSSIWVSDKNNYNVNQREMEKLAYFVEDRLSTMFDKN